MRLPARRRRASWCREIAGGGRSGAADAVAPPGPGAAELPGRRQSLVRLSAPVRPVRRCVVLAWSWFGLQVGLGVAVAVLAGLQGIPEAGSGGRKVLLVPVAGGQDD